MKQQNLMPEERNSIVWIERQQGVTSVVVRNKKTTKHRHAPGFAKLLAADARSATVRLYNKTGCRDLFVHAPSGPDRDKWLAAMANGGGFTPEKVSTVSGLKHSVPKATSFTPNVPTPRALDPKAGQIFEVTPDLAAKWLERNTRNRPLSSTVVLRYAADMAEGRWKVTGDAIAFDIDGAVINGQHRLWAVLESGKTVPMLTIFNLDPETVKVVDDHYKRRLTDIVHIASPGSTVQTKHTACARAMMFSLTVTDKWGLLSRASRQKQLDFMNRHFDAIQFAVRDCFGSANVRSITNASVLAVIARAYYTQNAERLKQFGHVLVSGMADGPDDSMGVAFRNWLISQDTRKARASRDAVYAKAERALSVFLARERGQKLYEATEEMFPLPEEMAPDTKVPRGRKLSGLGRGKAQDRA